MKIGYLLVCLYLTVACSGKPDHEAASSSNTSTQTASVAADAPPACGDEEVTETVQDIFDTHQAYETLTNLYLVSFSDPSETGNATPGTGEWRAIRGCAATGVLSNREHIELWYQIRMPRVDDAIGYRVKPCFSKYDKLSGGDCSTLSTVQED